MSPHNTRDEFRQLLKAENIDTIFRVNPVGRIYGVTFIDHNDGIVANGSVLGKEFSANAFNELYPTSKELKHAVEWKMQQERQQAQTGGVVANLIDSILNLADTHAYEEQMERIRRRRKKKRQP